MILTGHGGGLAERLALYPLIIWLIVFGYLILAKKVRPCDVPEPIHMRQSPTISAAGSVGDFELPARPR